MRILSKRRNRYGHGTIKLRLRNDSLDPRNGGRLTFEIHHFTRINECKDGDDGMGFERSTWSRGLDNKRNITRSKVESI